MPIVCLSFLTICRKILTTMFVCFYALYFIMCSSFLFVQSSFTAAIQIN